MATSPAQLTKHKLKATLPRLENGLVQVGCKSVSREGVERRVKWERLAVCPERDCGFASVNMNDLPEGVMTNKLLADTTLEHLSAVVGFPVVASKRSLLGRGGVTYCILFGGLPEEAKPKRYWVPTLLNYTDYYHAEFSQSPLDVPLGVDASGERLHTKSHVWEPLPRLQHVMIGGMTGGGKSTLVKCALAALLPYNSPKTLRVVLIDGKDALGPWRGVPHLFTPYAKGLETATYAIRVVKEELDRREQQSLDGGGDLDIDAYNARAKLSGIEPWPYLWVIIDEAGDLATEAGKQHPFYADMRSILQKGRSFGIFVWATAQNPTADVLSTAIKGQMQSYFAFKVMDNPTAHVLHCSNAETGDKEISAEKITIPGRCLSNYRGWPHVQLQTYFMPKDNKLRDKLIRIAKERWPAPTTVYEPQPGDALTDDDVTMCLTAIDNFSGQLDDGRWYYPIPVNATAEALPPSGKPGHLSQPRVRDRLSEFEQAGLIAYLDGDKTKGRVMTEKLLHELEGALQSRGIERQIPRFTPV